MGRRAGSGEPSNPRRDRRRWERRLLLVVLLTLVIVGGGIVALVYGAEALVGALPCLGAGAGAIVLLYAFFGLAERLVR
jgi:polyferredoxin